MEFIWDWLYCESLCVWSWTSKKGRQWRHRYYFFPLHFFTLSLLNCYLVWWLNTGIWVNRTLQKTNSQEKPVPCSVIFEHQHLSTTTCPLRICFVPVSNQISAHKQVTLLSVSSVNRQHRLDFWVTLVIATPQPLTTKQNRSSLHTCHSQLCHPGQGQACN